MSLHQAVHTDRIPAPPARCYEAVAEFETYPDWQDAVDRVAVLERYPDGRGKLVEVEIDLKLKRIRYRLIYHHEPPGRLWWKFVEGDGVAAIEGEFTFEPEDAGTLATYELGIDPGFSLPGPLARQIARLAMGRSIDDLRWRVG